MKAPSPPSVRAQSGLARRPALAALVGMAAAGAGGWLAWRRHGTSAPAGQDANNTASQPGAASGATPTAAASGPVITGDQLTAAFWQQRFDSPAGTPLLLAAAKGRPILINFWATWCPPCVKEMPELERFHREFSVKGWKVIGLAVDGPTPVKEFLAKVAVGFDIGLAGFGGTELAQALGNSSGGLPFSIVIDASGHVRHRKMGATRYEELAHWAASLPG